MHLFSKEFDKQNSTKPYNWQSRSYRYYQASHPFYHGPQLKNLAALIFKPRYMVEHPTEMSEFMAEYSKIENGKPKLDLSKYNFNALATSIVHESFWVVQLEHMRYDDRAGDSVGPDEVNSTVGVKPVFMIYCYDEQGGYRITNECTGLPHSKAVLE